MRAGNLDKLISIDAFSAATVAPNGTPSEGWQTVATMRAELVEASTEEYLRGYGEGGASSLIFRVYWRQGVTTDHRVTYEGRYLNIREVKEIGRRAGLELRCEEVRNAGN